MKRSGRRWPLHWSAFALGALLAACAAPSRRAPPPSAAPSAPEASAETLRAQISTDAKRSDSERGLEIRDQLASDATAAAQTCLARFPQAAACLYGQALALGLQARVHPARASEYLKRMLDALSSAEAANATYDEAGPARVRAMVLVRAPGWPVGPGDPDAGVAAGRRAVALRPNYPPNLLALAEALAKAGDAAAATETYSRARTEAQAQPPGPDRDEWLRQADVALKGK